MQPGRARKRDPHRCRACGARFDVTYFDDRESQRLLDRRIAVQARCPSCGHGRSVSLPPGAERTLEVALRHPGRDAAADSGGSG
jgi:hypothetical protein